MKNNAFSKISATAVFVFILLAFTDIRTVYAAGGATAFPGISAQAAVVLDATAGRFLYEKNPDMQMRIASTTKIMTAIVAIENSDLSDIVKIDKYCRAEGSSMYLKEGEEVSVNDLLYGLMLMSGNDAALALAYHCAGSVDAFAGMMNEKASEIGMKNSSFRNPNGLDEPGHFSTARDMALLSAYAMKNETFRKIAGTKSGYYAGRYMTNHNELLFRLEGVTGIKTGYTVASGRCLVSSYDRDGREIIVVTLNGRSDWQDHTALSDRAYSEYKPITAAEQGHVYANIPVMSGDIPTVGVYIEESCKLWIAEGEKIETVIYLPKFVYAPVRKGDAAGEISFVLTGKEIRRIPLRYDTDVTATDQYPGLFPNIAKFFKNIVRRLNF